MADLGDKEAGDEVGLLHALLNFPSESDFSPLESDCTPSNSQGSGRGKERLRPPARRISLDSVSVKK